MIRIAGIATVFLFVIGLYIAPLAFATPDQQNKMTTCNKEATAKGFGEGKGAERRAFMKECLSSKSVKSTKEAKGVKAGGTQQNK